MIELRNITEDNYRECLDLKVSESQKDFVAPNRHSLAQAWVFYDSAYPFAIYADDIMVGFIMLGYIKEEKQYTVWRLMIDEKFQKKGYGKAALYLGIEYLQKEFGINEVYLSYAPENAVGEALYESAGFKKTGEIEDGEIIMRLALSGAE